MCGIAGYISSSRCVNIENKVEGMLATIKHRGPNGAGIKSFNELVCLGHRRLAILDLSDAGLQPMNANERYWVTYNGEIYNYIELRTILEDDGFFFRTSTDTEVLLAAYIKWGEKCVNYFNGMWAFAIYDSFSNVLFCSRDRFGVKPFYYHIDESRGKFIFGSEIKEILAAWDVDIIKPQMDNLIAYLITGAIDIDEHTMFAGIDQLLGGYNLTLDCNTMLFHKYSWYELSKIRLNKNSIEDNNRLFAEKFMNAIRIRMRSDVSVGSCLSGGLDSSSIVCAVHEYIKAHKLEMSQCTVSSCFANKKYDEQEYIDVVVKKTGVTAYKIFPDMDAIFDDLDNIIWHMDEPFGGTSVYAQWNVFKEAKNRGLTVMLDGQGSDEQLAGYTPFYKLLFLELIRDKHFKRLYDEIGAYKKFRAESEVESMLEIVLSTLLTAYFPDSLRYLLNRLFRKKKGEVPFPAYFYDNGLIKRMWSAYDKRDSQKYIDASLHYGMRALLHYEDRDSMAHSIESRVPFLDYELVELIYSIPLNQKIVSAKTKNILREGLKDILPEEIYSRFTKLGFATPEDQWIKNNEQIVQTELSLACDTLANIIDKNQVMQWYHNNVSKIKVGDSSCFRIICVSRWAKIFNVVI